MASDVTLPIPPAVARRMAVVATTATDQRERSTLSRSEEHALRIVSSRLGGACSDEEVATVFGVGDGDGATITVSESTARTFLRALDTLAAGTPTPYERKACTAVFDHVTDHVDPAAIGLRAEQLEACSIAERATVFS